jgi:hypothetical protein
MTDRTKIDPAHDYCVRGLALQRLTEFSARLNQPHQLKWDERRDMANMLDLIVAEAFGL